jgi:hypothetical protein
MADEAGLGLAVQVVHGDAEPSGPYKGGAIPVDPPVRLGGDKTKICLLPSSRLIFSLKWILK